MAGSCEYSHELLGSMKGGEFTDQLSDYRLLETDSASHEAAEESSPFFRSQYCGQCPYGPDTYHRSAPSVSA
jgi:hypothetical protein